MFVNFFLPVFRCALFFMLVAYFSNLVLFSAVLCLFSLSQWGSHFRLNLCCVCVLLSREGALDSFLRCLSLLLYLISLIINQFNNIIVYIFFSALFRFCWGGGLPCLSIHFSSNSFYTVWFEGSSFSLLYVAICFDVTVWLLFNFVTLLCFLYLPKYCVS